MILVTITLARSPRVVSALGGFLVSVLWFVAAGWIGLTIATYGAVGANLLDTALPSWMWVALVMAVLVLVASRLMLAVPLVVGAALAILVFGFGKSEGLHPEFRSTLGPGLLLAGLTVVWSLGATAAWWCDKQDPHDDRARSRTGR